MHNCQQKNSSMCQNVASTKIKDSTFLNSGRKSRYRHWKTDFDRERCLQKMKRTVMKEELGLNKI